MDSLEIGKEYLVQVDGYLNDFCAFVIEVSDPQKGLRLVEKVTVQAGAEILNDQKVMLH